MDGNGQKWTKCKNVDSKLSIYTILIQEANMKNGKMDKNRQKWTKRILKIFIKQTTQNLKMS